MSALVQEPTPSSTPPSEPESSHETGDHSTDSDSDTSSDTKSTCVKRMVILCKEFTIMVVIAMAYAALTNESPPKVSRSPAAYPFFPRGSLVTDWYRGQITAAIENARSSDIAFVMFYAPWDAESQRARHEMELAAKYVGERVSFVAVNCWQPQSACRRQYSKVYKWPVLIAYPTHGRGIQYNGPLQAFHIVAFLNNVCNPLVRPQHLDDLLGKHDSIVSANINVLPGSPEYAVFYLTALRFLEKDPFRDTAFVVIPQAKDIPPKLSFHMWNCTLTYEDEWTTEILFTWVSKNLKQVATWVASAGTKSLTLSTYVQSHPTLILFTPKNPLNSQTDYFNMLRMIAFDYHNCANNTQLNHKLTLIELERLTAYQTYKTLRQKCPPKFPITINQNLWLNTSTRPSMRETCPDLDSRCKNFYLSETYSTSIFENGNTQNRNNITGFCCKTNTSLLFIAMDSLQYYHFADRLGIDLFEFEDKSAVVIVDEKMETHYVMRGRLNGRNLRVFIQNYTAKSLDRSLLGKAGVKSRSTLIYPTKNTTSDVFALVELTSETFLKMVLQKNKVVVVFYYSKQCAFCSGISYVVLSVAKMLKNVTNLVFARIDGDANLLPWEYTMESYPTILQFPAFRKAESRAFPKNMLVTVPNLLGFILANAEPALKLRTLWAVCGQTKSGEERNQCVTSLRTETLSTIEKTLREWRVSVKKQQVLYKLQDLRHLHLLFAHTPHEVVAIKNYLNKLKD